MERHHAPYVLYTAPTLAQLSREEAVAQVVYWYDQYYKDTWPQLWVRLFDDNSVVLREFRKYCKLYPELWAKLAFRTKSAIRSARANESRPYIIRYLNEIRDEYHFGWGNDSSVARNLKLLEKELAYAPELEDELPEYILHALGRGTTARSKT